jgi:hypothetical protein
MPKAKVFKDFITERSTQTDIESKISNFINNKTIHSIKQSVVAKPRADETYLIVITVIYDDK